MTLDLERNDSSSEDYEKSESESNAFRTPTTLKETNERWSGIPDQLFTPPPAKESESDTAGEETY